MLVGSSSYGAIKDPTPVRSARYVLSPSTQEHKLKPLRFIIQGMALLIERPQRGSIDMG